MTLTRGRIKGHALISQLYLCYKNLRIFIKYSNQNDGNEEAHNDESHKQMVEDEVNSYERRHLDGLVDGWIDKSLVTKTDGTYSKGLVGRCTDI